MGCIKLAYYENNNTLKVAFRAKDSTYLRDLNYYPGGMLMPGRSFNSNVYPNGYQGSRKDDEIAGITGANFTTFFREGSTLSCTWWSIDPKASATPWESPYVMMGDNPIWFNDPLGDDKYKVDRNGNVTLKRRTNKDYDKLVASGSIFNKQLKIDKGILDKKETVVVEDADKFKHTVDVYKGIVGDNGKKLFEFVSKNTDVEWSLWHFGDGGILPYNALTTSKNYNANYGDLAILQDQFFKFSDFSGHDHKHPIQENDKIPSGSNIDPAFVPLYLPNRTGDVGFAKQMENMFQNKKPVFRIYTVRDGGYINYTGDTFIDKTFTVKPKP